MGLGRWKYTFPDERARLLGIRFFFFRNFTV